MGKKTIVYRVVDGEGCTDYYPFLSDIMMIDNNGNFKKISTKGKMFKKIKRAALIRDEYKFKITSELKIHCTDDYLRSIVNGIKNENIRNNARDDLMELHNILRFLMRTEILDLDKARIQLIEYANSLNPETELYKARGLYNNRIMAGSTSMNAQLNQGYVYSPGSVNQSNPFDRSSMKKYTGPIYDMFPPISNSRYPTIAWFIAMKIYSQKYAEPIVLFKTFPDIISVKVNTSVKEQLHVINVITKIRGQYNTEEKVIEIKDYLKSKLADNDFRIVEITEEIFKSLKQIIIDLYGPFH